MVATFLPIIEREVAEIGVRRGWHGTLVLQVRRRCERVRVFGGPESAGMTPWRDADANNPSEIAEVLRLMTHKDKGGK